MNRRFTLVLGMHRSGTSALTGAVHELGAHLGGDLVPAAADNPGGYFENAAVVSINETLLLGLERGWDDPSPLPAEWLTGDAAIRAGEAIDVLLAADFSEPRWYVIKDPRLCRLLPLWMPRLERAGPVDVVLALRSPDAVVASLVRRDRMWPDDALRLLLLHLTEAERSTRSHRRAVSDYDVLLATPESELRRLSTALDWPVAGSAPWAAATSLLDAGQRHHRADAVSDADPSLRAISLRLHTALLASGNDVSCEDAALLGPEVDVAHGGDERNRGLRWALLRERRRLHDSESGYRELGSAFQRVEQSALERLEALTLLDRCLGDTQQALSQAEALALARLAELEALAREHDALSHQLVGAAAEAAVVAEANRGIRTDLEAQVASAEARAADLAANLQAVKASRSWRWTAPMRWLALRWRGENP